MITIPPADALVIRRVPFLYARNRATVMDDRTSNASARSTTPAGRPAEFPKTDIGTIVLHWVVALAFIVSLFTGLRIAADALIAPVSQWLTPILPYGDMWIWHFMSGLVLFFGASAYVLYVMRSGLIQRNAVKKTRVLAMPAPPRNEMGGGQCDPALVRLWPDRLHVRAPARCSISATAAGGFYLHSTAAFVGLAYIFVHIVAHYMHGGWWRAPAHLQSDASGHLPAPCGRSRC